METTVSVIIPFYKRQAVFEETLKSVLAQTIKPLEIIVVDDASGADAVKFLGRFKEHIDVIELAENVGVSKARNIGVDKAKGEYIAFLDSDDLWLPNKLEKQLKYIRENPDCDVVHTGTANFYPDGSDVKYIDKPHRLSKADMIISSHVMFQSVLMRRDDFVRVGGFDSNFRQTEDYEFSMRLIKNRLTIDFIPEVLVRVRHGHADKLSLNWKGFIKGHVRVVWRYAEFYKEVEGFLGPYKHTVKYLIKGGFKRGGMGGRLIRVIGYCLYPTIRI